MLNRFDELNWPNNGEWKKKIIEENNASIFQAIQANSYVYTAYYDSYSLCCYSSHDTCTHQCGQSWMHWLQTNCVFSIKHRHRLCLTLSVSVPLFFLAFYVAQLTRDWHWNLVTMLHDNNIATFNDKGVNRHTTLCSFFFSSRIIVRSFVLWFASMLPAILLNFQQTNKELDRIFLCGSNVSVYMFLFSWAEIARNGTIRSRNFMTHWNSMNSNLIWIKIDFLL